MVSRFITQMNFTAPSVEELSDSATPCTVPVGLGEVENFNAAEQIIPSTLYLRART